MVVLSASTYVHLRLGDPNDCAYELTQKKKKRMIHPYSEFWTEYISSNEALSAVTYRLLKFGYPVLTILATLVNYKNLATF